MLVWREYHRMIVSSPVTHSSNGLPFYRQAILVYNRVATSRAQRSEMDALELNECRQLGEIEFSDTLSTVHVKPSVYWSVNRQ